MSAEPARQRTTGSDTSRELAEWTVPELVEEVERLRRTVSSLKVGQGNAMVLLSTAADQYDQLLRDGDL